MNRSEAYLATLPVTTTFAMLPIGTKFKVTGEPYYWGSHIYRKETEKSVLTCYNYSYYILPEHVNDAVTVVEQ